MKSSTKARSCICVLSFLDRFTAFFSKLAKKLLWVLFDASASLDFIFLTATHRFNILIVIVPLPCCLNRRARDEGCFVLRKSPTRTEAFLAANRPGLVHGVAGPYNLLGSLWTGKPRFGIRVLGFEKKNGDETRRQETASGSRGWNWKEHYAVRTVRERRKPVPKRTNGSSGESRECA